MAADSGGTGSAGNNTFEVQVDLPEARANSLLDLLVAGEIRRAEKLSHAALAEELFAEKSGDPVSAVVGGYYLLRVDALDRFHDWSQKLSLEMPWMSDGAIIHGWFLLRSGAAASPTAAEKLKRQCTINSSLP